MPTLRTVVSDLYHNEVKGVGGGFSELGTRSISDEVIISSAHHLKTFSQPAKFSFGMKNLSFVIDVTRSTRPESNGSALFFEDGQSTLATISRAHRIVGGGGYSGCMYSVYKAPGGEFKCVHTARPSGANADKYLNELRAYAPLQGWTLVHEVPTAGLVGGNCITVFCLTRVSYTINPIVVRTVRLGLDRTGFSVTRHRWNTPAP